MFNCDYSITCNTNRSLFVLWNIWGSLTRTTTNAPSQRTKYRFALHFKCIHEIEQVPDFYFYGESKNAPISVTIQRKISSMKKTKQKGTRRRNSCSGYSTVCALSGKSQKHATRFGTSLHLGRGTNRWTNE